jgi:L-amino acid N-acyltransferase YncA
MSVLLRPATVDDLVRINDIYNHFVVTSTCTYQEEPDTSDARRAWFERHGGEHPVIVAEVEGDVVGWGSLSPFHSRCAYRFTVENSIYVDYRFHGRGVGGLLLDELIAQARALGHHTIVALIDESQAASVALHARKGFTKAGQLSEVGFKFQRWLDLVYMQLRLQ